MTLMRPPITRGTAAAGDRLRPMPRAADSSPPVRHGPARPSHGMAARAITAFGRRPRSLVGGCFALLLLAGCSMRGDHAGPGGIAGVNVADAALSGGMPDTALNVTRSILQAHPRDVGALERQGIALEQLNQPDAAMEAWRRALAVDPAAAPALLGIGRLDLARGDAAAAGQSFNRLLATAPNDRAALNDLGVALDMQGRHAAAQAAYGKLLGLDPGDRAASVNLALSLSLSGQAARSVEILRGPGEQPGAPPRVRQDLAVALALSGKPREAEKLLLTDLSPGDAAAALAGYEALDATHK